MHVLLCVIFLTILFCSSAQDCSEMQNCSGHGDCVLDNVCSCNNGYYEDSLVGCASLADRTQAPTPMVVLITDPPSPTFVGSIVRDGTTTGASNSEEFLDFTNLILLVIGAVVLCLLIILCAVGCLMCQVKPEHSFSVAYRTRKAQFSNRMRDLSGRYNDQPHNEMRTAHEASGPGASMDDYFVATMNKAPQFEQARPAREQYVALPKGIAIATALYDFSGEQPGDLPFKKGDMIQLLQHTNNWWEGKAHGKTGVFPRNYVQLTRESTWNPPAPSVGVRAVRDSFTQLKKKQACARCNEKLTLICQKCQALYDFEGTEPGDLSLSKGDIVELTQASDTWWEGSCNGHFGVFPRNYVRLLGERR